MFSLKATQEHDPPKLEGLRSSALRSKIFEDFPQGLQVDSLSTDPTVHCILTLPTYTLPLEDKPLRKVYPYRFPAKLLKDGSWKRFPITNMLSLPLLYVKWPSLDENERFTWPNGPMESLSIDLEIVATPFDCYALLYPKSDKSKHHGDFMIAREDGKHLTQHHLEGIIAYINDRIVDMFFADVSGRSDHTPNSKPVRSLKEVQGKFNPNDFARY